jgi:hypothetical protein
MKKQTAVEWLVAQVNADCLNSVFITPDLIDKAKAMEKEQMIDAYDYGYTEGWHMDEHKSEQYYNETYNTKTL